MPFGRQFVRCTTADRSDESLVGDTGESAENRNQVSPEVMTLYFSEETTVLSLTLNCLACQIRYVWLKYEF